MYNNLTKATMQSKIDQLNAYANKIALALSIRQHTANKTTIQQTGANMFHFKIAPFLQHNLQTQEFSHKEQNLCDYALGLAQSGQKMDELFARKYQIQVEQLLACEDELVRIEEGTAKGDLFKSSLQFFKGLNLELKENKKKLREFILAHYRKLPRLTGKLIIALGLSKEKVKLWIQYNMKREKRIQLRDQVMRLSEDQEITFEKFKKISRKFHKSRRFTATNKWCAEYIKSYGLENIIEIPPHMK